MDLFFFPTDANNKSGYGIACESDYERLEPKLDDLVVWFSNNEENVCRKQKDIILSRPARLGGSRFLNMFRLRASTEVSKNDLVEFLKDKDFEKIFCGDVIFYRAVRELFPNKKIIVRFHNCFGRILVRRIILDYNFDFKFEYNLRAFFKLENQIFRDKNVHKIFISKEDKDFYELMTGCDDYSVWPFEFNEREATNNRKPIHYNNKIVFFGGVSSHKRSSVEWFINKVLPEIRKKIPTVEFHLWGKNTKQFNNPDKLIFGHGFYSLDDFPLNNEALYINPDVIGGGVKLKLLSYYNNGIPCISTPFGYEGYSHEYIDDTYCMVSSTDKWSADIVDILRNGCKVK